MSMMTGLYLLLVTIVMVAADEIPGNDDLPASQSATEVEVNHAAGEDEKRGRNFPRGHDFPLARPGKHDCLREARKGHCRVVDCYKNKFRACPNAIHTLVTKDFCIAAHKGLMETPLGLAWIRRTNRCVLLSFALRAQMITCSTIDKQLQTIFRDCARDSGICDILDTEFDYLHRTFQDTWMMLLEAGQECPREVLDTFVQRSLRLRSAE